MELIVDNLQNCKHFCKICHKGFLCGSALGGHMRAHGTSEDHEVESCTEEKNIDWDDRNRGGSSPPNNKRMHALRTNLNRHRFNRICENCGDEFLSWKSFLEHGKCKFDDVNSFVTYPKSNEDKEDTRPYGWSKRKRSFETNILSSIKLNDCTSSEEEDLANCLLMLSNIDRLKESCAYSTCKEDEIQNPISIIAPTITKTCTPPNIIDHKVRDVNVVSTNTKNMYECKACKRVFNSHQALGGHRASHKKVKGCFAARLDHVDQDEDNTTEACNLKFTRPEKLNPSLTMSNKKKNKVHECSICHRVFSSGQALGGHKRCHWITSNDPSMLARFREVRDQTELIQEVSMFRSNHALDLNDIPSQHEKMVKVSQSPKSLLSFELSTDIVLQSWTNCDPETKNASHGDHINKGGEKTNILQSNNNKVHNDEEDTNSKIELAKLCEIKNDLNSNGCSSPWLQVGIGSNNVVVDKP